MTSPHFSPRELEIARLVAEGLTSAQIAGRIGWTEGSVRVTVCRMGTKLDGQGTPRHRIARWWLLREVA